MLQLNSMLRAPAGPVGQPDARMLWGRVILAGVAALVLVFAGLWLWLWEGSAATGPWPAGGHWESGLDPLRLLFVGWLEPASFSQSTINGIRMGDTNAPLPLTVVVSLWLLVAATLFLGMHFWSTGPVFAGLLALFLVAWIVLDVRWQADLWQEHRETLERFLGVPAAERTFPGMGGAEFLQLINGAHDHLGRNSRVLIISKQDGPALYARYRLLPLPGYRENRVRSRTLRQMQAGDGVLLLGNSDAELLSFRSGLSLAMRARFPVVLDAEELGGGHAKLREQDARPLLEYAGQDEGDVSGDVARAVPAAFYRVVALLETPTEHSGARLEVRRIVESGDGGKRERIAQKVLRSTKMSGFEEHSLAFAVPRRERLELGLRDLPPGTRIAELRLEYPDDADDWLILTRDRQPPYRAVRMRTRSALGVLLELQ